MQRILRIVLAAGLAAGMCTQAVAQERRHEEGRHGEGRHEEGRVRVVRPRERGLFATLHQLRPNHPCSDGRHCVLGEGLCSDSAAGLGLTTT